MRNYVFKIQMVHILSFVFCWLWFSMCLNFRIHNSTSLGRFFSALYVAVPDSYLARKSRHQRVSLLPLHMQTLAEWYKSLNASIHPIPQFRPHYGSFGYPHFRQSYNLQETGYPSHNLARCLNRVRRHQRRRVAGGPGLFGSEFKSSAAAAHSKCWNSKRSGN